MPRPAALLRAAALLLLLSLSSVWAQGSQVDADSWETLAQRAERMVEANAASNERFEDLRAEIGCANGRLTTGVTRTYYYDVVFWKHI